MNVWTALVIIVAITSIARVLRARYLAQHGIVEERHGKGRRAIRFEDSSERAEMQHELDRLRDRVKVLERIATDANTSEVRHSRAIAEEIESLRDK